MTSALLKLPQSLSRQKKEERVEQILTELVRGPGCSEPASQEMTMRRGKTLPGLLSPAAQAPLRIGWGCCTRGSSCAFSKCSRHSARGGPWLRPLHAGGVDGGCRYRWPDLMRAGGVQELQQVKDTLIGEDVDGAVSGISGGERRRVSVGIGTPPDPERGAHRACAR